MPGAGVMKLMMELHARDLTGGALNSATANTKRLARTTKSEFSGMMNSVASYRKLVGSIVTAKVLSRGFAYLERGIYNVGAAIVDTDQALTAASAKFGDVADRGTEGFSRMEGVVEGIGGSTEFFANEAAQSIDFMAMAGFEYEQALRAMVPLTDLATTAQMELARASDIASDALGAFGLSTDVADIEQSLNRVNDVFAETVTSSNTTMETLFDTMKHSGPAVVAAGGDIEMFATLAGKLGSAGIKSTIAGTTLKNMFTRLIAPPSEARKALKKLNLDIDDGTGRMKDMITILGELNGAFAGRSEISREKFIKDIFGMRAISGVNVLLNEGEESLRAYNERVTDSAGAAKEMADVMRGGLGVQLKVLESAFMQKGFEIFNGLMGEDDPAEAVAELSRVIRGFDTSETVEAIKAVGEVAKWTAEFLWENKAAIAAFAKVWMATNIAGRITGVATSVIGLGAALTGAGGLVSAAGATTAGLGAATAATGALKVGLENATPVIMAAVAGLTAGYEIWKALEAEQEAAVARDNKYITLATSSGGRSVEEQKSEAASIEADLQRMYDLRGSRGKKNDLGLALEGVISGKGSTEALKEALAESGWKQERKDLTLYKAEAMHAIWRRTNAATGMRDARGAHEDRLRAEEAYRTGGTSERKVDDAPWLSGYDSTRSHGVTEVEDPTLWKANTGQETTDMSSAKYRPPAAIPSINWDPEFKIKVDVNGLPEGATASAEVTQAPSVSEASLGVPNG